MPTHAEAQSHHPDSNHIPATPELSPAPVKRFTALPGRLFHQVSRLFQQQTEQLLHRTRKQLATEAQKQVPDAGEPQKEPEAAASTENALLRRFNERSQQVRERVAAEQERVLAAIQALPPIPVQDHRPQFENTRVGHVETNQVRVFDRTQADFVGSDGFGPCVGLFGVTKDTILVLHTSGFVPATDLDEPYTTGLDLLEENIPFFEETPAEELDLFLLGDNHQRTDTGEFINDPVLAGVYLWLEDRGLTSRIKAANVRDVLAPIAGDNTDPALLTTQQAATGSLTIATADGTMYPGVSQRWQGISI